MAVSQIFKISNDRTSKIFVGHTKNPTLTWRQYQTLLVRGKFSNADLQRDWNRGDEFTFSILDVCDERYATEMKTRWIEDLDRQGIELYNTSLKIPSRSKKIEEYQHRRLIAKAKLVKSDEC